MSGHTLRMTEEEFARHQKRVQMIAQPQPWRSRVDGYRAAKRVYVCTECLAWHTVKVKVCSECGREAIQHFASTGEARRYAELRLMQREGHIERLEVQPRYDVLIHGLKVCTYVADFRYRDLATHETVVEDCKGSRAHQDPTSALRRRCAEAYHAITVTLIGG